MHYIRPLRAPKLIRVPRSLQLELVFSITTDLGDAFLSPSQPLSLGMTAHFETPSGPSSQTLQSISGDTFAWKHGDRVAKPIYNIPKLVLQALVVKSRVEICISPIDSEFIADSVTNILQHSQRNNASGQVVPVWLALSASKADIDLCTRKLQLEADNNDLAIEIEEEIGESIARHIWDAGVVSLCSIAGAVLHPQLESPRHACMEKMNDLLRKDGPLNILELGCGVGILGLGIATILARVGVDTASILMTDLEEAEERAKANMSRNAQYLQNCNLKYENLDWEDGRKGRFSSTIAEKPWDLIILSDCTYNVDMLPALVETLSALHKSSSQNKRGDSHETQVFLATKPRHDSERALFKLTEEHNWTILQKQILPLPVIGEQQQSIEMYIFGKK